MKEVFSKFPEVLLLDGTYSINNCGMPLYSFLAEDGHGQGQIVGMILLSGENSIQIKTMTKIFL